MATNGFAALADQCAAAVRRGIAKVGRQPTSAQLRDQLDLLTGGEFDTVQLDILQGMVEERIKGSAA